MMIRGDSFRDTPFKELGFSQREYYLLPKGFLMPTEDRLQRILDSLQNSQDAEDLLITAWCQIELSILQNYRGLEDVDRRLMEVADAGERLCKAEDTLLDMNLDPNDGHIFRVRMARHFLPLFSDLAAGEVTSATLEEVFRDVRDELEFIYTTYEHGNEQLGIRKKARGFRGLLSEYEILLLSLKYADSPKDSDKNILFIPSAPRADDGRTFSEFTHDTTALRVRQVYGQDSVTSRISHIEPFEVKTSKPSFYNKLRTYKAITVYLHDLIPRASEPQIVKAMLEKPRTKRVTSTDMAYQKLLQTIKFTR